MYDRASLLDSSDDEADPPVRGGWYFAVSPDSEPDAVVEVEPLPAATPLVPLGASVSGLATHYGPRYGGQSLGCGAGVYTSDNPLIVAVGPARYREWPCGTTLQVCGSAGCIQGTRVDGCPGCSAYLLDLSEAGIALTCGDQSNVCRVQIQRLQMSR
jgi:hypothetical protein